MRLLVGLLDCSDEVIKVNGMWALMVSQPVGVLCTLISGGCGLESGRYL